ncbi:MAG: hypothetical protein LBT40_17025 [Deltaproteobacteria bacterium]|jgi:hypothetical protein|nr:hypothetical protein [Deltaproteobacteria bacterium]
MSDEARDWNPMTVTMEFVGNSLVTLWEMSGNYRKTLWKLSGNCTERIYAGSVPLLPENYLAHDIIKSKSITRKIIIRKQKFLNFTISASVHSWLVSLRNLCAVQSSGRPRFSPVTCPAPSN